MEDSKKDPQLDQIFTRIRDYLDQMDTLREQLLPLQRTAVRICSEIIKNVHRKQLDSIPTQIQEVVHYLKQMQELLKKAPGDFTADYLSIVQQEYGEAALLYNIIVHHSYLTPENLGIGLLEYAYACADVVGELRRYALDALRNGLLDIANHTLEEMDEIFTHLFSLDYPKGLIPGLRPKIDQARNILARTEGDLAVSANVLKLNQNLEKLNLQGKLKLPRFEDSETTDEK
jgi:translin